MTQEATQSTFGYKWERWPDAGHGTEHASPEYRIKRNGWKVKEFEDWIEGKTVLDAGTGVGWWTHYMNELNKSGRVVGVEIARDAVLTGYDLGYKELIHGDITKLPFEDETFDYISCEGVLHHTPDPAKTLKHLSSKLKPGGIYTMYIYKQKPLLRETADTVVRQKTTELDIEDCAKFAEQLTELGKELNKLDDDITVPDIPILDIEAGTYSVHEFIYKYFLKCYYDWDAEDWDTSVSVNFDWYHPEFAYRYTKEQVLTMISDAGLEIKHLNEQMSGFSVRARK